MTTAHAHHGTLDAVQGACLCCVFQCLRQEALSLLHGKAAPWRAAISPAHRWVSICERCAASVTRPPSVSSKTQGAEAMLAVHACERSLTQSQPPQYQAALCLLLPKAPRHVIKLSYPRKFAHPAPAHVALAIDGAAPTHICAQCA